MASKNVVIGQTDAALFLSCFKNMTADPRINFEAVAEDCGYKNAGTAKTRFGQVRRKFLAVAGDPAAGPKTPPDVKPKPARKKPELETPKGKRARANTIKVEPQPQDDDEPLNEAKEEAIVKVKEEASPLSSEPSRFNSPEQVWVIHDDEV